MDLNAPLSDAEFDELDNFLMSDAVGDSAMDVSMLDGFLTAIVIGPQTLSPSLWLPRVWGKKEMEWESPAQAERITGFIMRHLNGIVAQFAEEPEDFQPVTYMRENEAGEEIEIIDEWCVGFVEGISLDADAWQDLLEADEHKELMFPIFLHGTDAGWEEMQKNAELIARESDFVEALPDCVIGIHEFWLPFRQAAAGKQTIRHDEPAAARNDPCPCGSGKKFKKCCGDPSKMH